MRVFCDVCHIGLLHVNKENMVQHLERVSITIYVTYCIRMYSNLKVYKTKNNISSLTWPEFEYCNAIAYTYEYFSRFHSLN